MELYDGPSRAVDMTASFGSESLPPGRYHMNHDTAARAETGSSGTSLEKRLAACKLRPTVARVSVLDALEKVAPSCLDANQMYRILCRQVGGLTPGSIYRALSDLWIAGLVVRTEGARGRAFYAAKPDALSEGYVTLRCHCSARLVFIEDLALREHLRSLVAGKGFALDAEPAFTITTTCTKCRQLRKEGWKAAI